MTAFKFNFSGNEDLDNPKELEDEQVIQWYESSEIIPSTQIEDLDRVANHAKMFTCADVEIGHVIINEMTTKIVQSDFTTLIDLAKKEHTDLVAGIYEGGLKIWECTSDLINYFEENKDELMFESKKVLDLGCGAGILGIYALMNKANVVFQDYNKEVINYVTIPNVLLNIEEEERESHIKKCKFYCGDWASFNKVCDDKFDIIMTSETIYNETNYQKLISLFLDKLNTGGSIYVAAKTHYFGVGGGTRQFEQVIKNNASFNIDVCWKSSGGIQREILKITRNIST